MAKKIGNRYAQLYTEPPVIVFGTQRIGAIYALRAGTTPERIRLATSGGDCLSGISSGTITVVRVAPEVWIPPTFSCEQRTRETEQALKAAQERGAILDTVWLA